MGKNQGSSARRAKKKHEKALKRRKILARRPQMAPLSGAPAQRPGVTLYDMKVDLHALGQGIEAFMNAEQFPTYYEAALEVDRLEWPPDLHRAWRDELWSPAKVAALPTSELVERLAGLGVHTDAEAFVASIPRFVSAVELARDLWLPGLSPSSHVFDRDFVCLAACELWQRWGAARPSQEMILLPLLAGYHAFYDSDDVEAARQWIAFWKRLDFHLPPEVRTTEAAEKWLGQSSDLLVEWFLDLPVSACRAARHDAAIGPDVAAVIEGLFSRFGDELGGNGLDVEDAEDADDREIVAYLRAMRAKLSPPPLGSG